MVVRSSLVPPAPPPDDETVTSQASGSSLASDGEFVPRAGKLIGKSDALPVAPKRPVAAERR